MANWDLTLRLGLVFFAASLLFGCAREPEQKPLPPERPAIPLCKPSCEGRECGDDGCRGSCGKCPERSQCNRAGLCEPLPCSPTCQGRSCGDDGCGGECGQCPAGRQCSDDGQCREPPCTPDCANRECDHDGCGGSCGQCKPGYLCRAGRCEREPCVPDCNERVCGDDGCGGSCGRCPMPNQCAGGRCDRRIAVGLHVGDGREDWQQEPVSLGEFTRRLGVTPAAFHGQVGFPSDWSGKCEFGLFPKAFADEALAAVPTTALMLTLLPQCDFGAFVQGFEAGSPAYEATVKFARECAAFPGRVFLRFAPDMNTHWYPWATCFFGNDKAGCTADPGDYRKAFANFAALVKSHAGENTELVWSVHEWAPYWAHNYSNYPAYDQFYPGDEVVDWVGISLYYLAEEMPRKGEFTARLRGFYDQFSAPTGHGKPLVITESAVECQQSGTTEGLGALGDFDQTTGWWGNWGRLERGRQRGASSVTASRIRGGESHIVLQAPPATGDPTGRPHDSGGYYVGGTAFPLAWDKGNDLSKGNVILFSARRDQEGDSPRLQIDLCDVDESRCAGTEPCCEKGTISASVSISDPEWKLYQLPYSAFAPTLKGHSINFDWRRVRLVKLHLMVDSPTGNLAPLHLDGFSYGRWSRAGAHSCDRRTSLWGEQLFSPQQCFDWPNLKMIFWHHDRKEQGGTVRDTRIHDYDEFKGWLADPCLQGRFW